MYMMLCVSMLVQLITDHYCLCMYSLYLCGSIAEQQMNMTAELRGLGKAQKSNYTYNRI